MFSSNEVREAVGLPPDGGGRGYTSVSTDTRTLQPGALFVALKGERHDAVDLLPEAEAKGAVGAVVPEDRALPVTELELFGVGDPSELRPGYRGIREPPADARPVDLADVDLFVVPGMAFDRRGNRLGRGGGHYDRLLQAAGPRARRIGLCYAERVLERIPVAPWDRSVQCIVTENEVIRT